MGDVFVEQIIKKGVSLGGLAIRIGAIFLVIIGLLLIPLFGILGITITVLLGYLAYLAFVYTSVELEYSFVNGELTIDRILGKRKRKPGETYDIRNAELIAPANSEEVARKSEYLTKLDYTGTRNTDDHYAIIIDDVDGVKGALMITIEPDERLVEAMYNVRPNSFIK